MSRDELARVVVDASISKNSRFTVEAYRKQTRTELQKEFKASNNAKFVVSVDEASRD